MNVQVTHHVDAGEQDANGMYDYFYEYDIYEFSDGRESLIARSYTDTPLQAHFLRIANNGKGRRLCRKDLAGKLFHDAIAYLRQKGKAELYWLSNGPVTYEPIA